LRSSRTAVILLAVWLSGCRTAPVPPEVHDADVQERDLQRAGAPVFAGPEHAAYIESLRSARRTLERESLKLGWFRDYERVRADFAAVVIEGNALLAKIETSVARRSALLAETAGAVRKRLRTLDGLTLSLVERGEARQRLTRASLVLDEAEALAEQRLFEKASERLAQASDLAGEAERAVVTLIARYLDPSLVQTWKRAADETIAESKKRGGTALIVSKLERRLAVYKKGELLRTYAVGLGFNGLADKRISGDNATPEGRYSIVRKNPSSLYHKALLIDYPNGEDRRWFAQEKARGHIPRDASIGGNVEIHGGGRDTLTSGCVSLDDDKMDELYALVAVGTPVTIIGTMELDNFVLKAIREK
jgi:L,D-peptidoglycan transpeptidase YkuD (ErfK/YbiS/YcfS/YnhG family)